MFIVKKTKKGRKTNKINLKNFSFGFQSVVYCRIWTFENEKSCYEKFSFYDDLLQNLTVSDFLDVYIFGKIYNIFVIHNINNKYI